MLFLRRNAEYIVGLITFTALKYSLKHGLSIKIPGNFENILTALSSVFGSLVGFSLAALGIVFAVIQRPAYDVLFRTHHAESFFAVFKNNQIISFVCFAVSAVGLLDSVAKDPLYICLLTSVIVSWVASIFQLVRYFNYLVNAEVRIRRKPSKRVKP